MKNYFIRSVKYLVALVVLYVGLTAVMHYSTCKDFSLITRWQIMFEHEPMRSWGLVGVSLLLAATYPFFGYVKRSFEGNIVLDREQLDSAARVAGLELVTESPTELVYRANGLRRLVMLYEDTVIVRQIGEKVEVDGLRRVAARIAFDAERYITNKRRAE